MTKTDEVLPALDVFAFVVALILAPIMVAALFFWVILVPVFALFFGAIPYLVFGSPVLLWIVTHTRVTFWGCALGGLLAQGLFVMSMVAGLATYLSIHDRDIEFLGLWGIPFSAVWCGSFALLYNSFHPATVSREPRPTPEPDIIS